MRDYKSTLAIQPLLMRVGLFAGAPVLSLVYTLGLLSTLLSWMCSTRQEAKNGATKRRRHARS